MSKLPHVLEDQRDDIIGWVCALINLISIFNATRCAVLVYRYVTKVYGPRSEKNAFATTLMASASSMICTFQTATYSQLNPTSLFQIQASWHFRFIGNIAFETKIEVVIN